MSSFLDTETAPPIAPTAPAAPAAPPARIGTDTVVSGATRVVSGADSGTLVRPGGTLVLSSGFSETALTVQAGAVVVFGAGVVADAPQGIAAGVTVRIDSGATINEEFSSKISVLTSDTVTVLSGGVVTHFAVQSGGVLSVASGGEADNGNVASGGSLFAAGAIIDTMVASGAIVTSQPTISEASVSIISGGVAIPPAPDKPTTHAEPPVISAPNISATSVTSAPAAPPAPAAITNLTQQTVTIPVNPQPLTLKEDNWFLPGSPSPSAASTFVDIQGTAANVWSTAATSVNPAALLLDWLALQGSNATSQSGSIAPPHLAGVETLNLPGGPVTFQYAAIHSHTFVEIRQT
jgi:hypothetical protein